MKSLHTRIRRQVSAENNGGDVSLINPSGGSELSLEWSDKMLKLRRRQKQHQNCLFGAFVVLLMLAIGSTKLISNQTTTTTIMMMDMNDGTASSTASTNLFSSIQNNNSSPQQRRTTTVVTTTTTTTTTSSSSSTSNQNNNIPKPTTTTVLDASSTTTQNSLLLERAKAHYKQCQTKKDDQFDRRTMIPYRNHSLPSLPAFGVLDDFNTMIRRVTTVSTTDTTTTTLLDTSWSSQPQPNYCTLPNPTACDQSQLTVIFLAYNPDRLGKMYNEMKKLISYDFVAELVLVWNGQRDIYESMEYGRKVVEISRVVYPIRDFGLPNDLMNRYHPQVLGHLKTDCLLYYDDDGPFYSKEVIFSALELWKRNSRHQIGAMARHVRSSSQPVKLEHPNDTTFTPYCAKDTVEYEFRFFANYDAQMVLPSGSMIHRQYLCFIWHDDMKVIRKFVLEHPVHPDDMTVSMLISQLAGVAPKVYSRRLRPQSVQQKQKRRLQEMEHDNDHYIQSRSDHDTTTTVATTISEYEDHALYQYTMHRRLAAAGMGGVCWDCGSGMTEQKEIWAYLRTEAIASLVRYFGSLTTGSIGWCTMDSPYYQYHRDGRCVPDMAEIGALPWMNPDGSPKDECP